MLIVLLLTACGSSGDQAGTQSVTGTVVEVEARSITEFETLRLLDSEGVVWTFSGGRFAGFTPSHLREHEVLGVPVTVWFESVGDALRAIRIEDAG